jgi:hypothetical protein
MNIDPEAAAAGYRERRWARCGAAPRSRRSGRWRSSSPAPARWRWRPSTSSRRCWWTRSASAASTTSSSTPRPPGHTLRLLQLPAAWSGFLEQNERGASCLGPVSGRPEQQERYAATVRALRDPERTTVVLVSRPEERRAGGGRAHPRRARRAGPGQPAADPERRLRGRRTGTTRWRSRSSGAARKVLDLRSPGWPRCRVPRSRCSRTTWWGWRRCGLSAAAPRTLRAHDRARGYRYRCSPAGSLGRWWTISPPPGTGW